MIHLLDVVSYHVTNLSDSVIDSLLWMLATAAILDYQQPVLYQHQNHKFQPRHGYPYAGSRSVACPTPVFDFPSSQNRVQHRAFSLFATSLSHPTMTIPCPSVKRGYNQPCWQLSTSAAAPPRPGNLLQTTLPICEVASVIECSGILVYRTATTTAIMHGHND